ncbi:MAG: HEAT repeat domain-containing protein [Planctomycetes bacterium]|nr:HEAT repeat domain-containing protein [Planctomycetota bacterium]
MAELHFCTVCGVSITQAEVDSAQALIHGERSVCPKCLTMLGQVGPKRSGGGISAIVLAVVALVGASYSWWDGEQARKQVRIDVADTFRVQAGAYTDAIKDNVEEVFAAMAQESGLTAAQIEGLSDRLRSFEEAMDSRLKALQVEIDQLGQLALDIDAMGRRVSKSESELTITTERLGEQRNVASALRDRMGTLEASQRELAARGPAATAEGGVEEFAPAIAGLLRKLRSSDQDERLDALEKLSAQEDRRLVPHLIPMLTDPYEFNRFYAAKTLGDWRSKASVPHLIESLLDEIGFVRQAAVQSLRLITGQNFRFGHDAAETERKQGYDSWKTWWNTNGKSFLEG